ncbi:hypothetical protein M9458_031678, partial [Cirrhinus mrigala]
HNDGLPGSVFLLSRSTFSHPSNLLPWRSGNSGSYWKSHRRAPSSESLSGLEQPLNPPRPIRAPAAPALRTLCQSMEGLLFTGHTTRSGTL